MLFQNSYEHLYTIFINDKVETFNNSISSFYRVGYFVQLQSIEFGNQWIYTEFDTFTNNHKHLALPKVIHKCTISNVLVQSNVGLVYNNLPTGKINFTPFNYDNNLFITHGNYGCMQVLSQNNDVFWAFNNIHNQHCCDIGIGDNLHNNNKDWTFMNNSNYFKIKLIKIFGISINLNTLYHLKFDLGNSKSKQRIIRIIFP